MNKKNLLAVSFAVILLGGCGSKAEKAAQKVETLRDTCKLPWHNVT